MQVFKSFLCPFVVACALWAPASRADLISNLTGLGFTLLAPGAPDYPNATRACKQFAICIPTVSHCIPNNAQDVSAVLKVGSAYNYQVVARSGGHSYIANGLGGNNGVVVVDMSNFRDVSVDLSTQIAAIGTGNRLGDVALALNNSGRALPHGLCTYVGIGGHSGHGGYGFTSRKWGLTLDTIQSLDVVLANGTIATASSTSYPDLFWALRGSSSSFGIVTTIHASTFAAPPSVTIFEYDWDLSAPDAADVLGAFQNYSLSPTIAQEFGAEIALARGPSQGRVLVKLVGGWYAPPDQFDAAIAPLLATLPPTSNQTLTRGSYIDSVQYLGGLGRLSTAGKPDIPNTFYAKSLMTPEASPMSAEARNAFTDYLTNQGATANTDWLVEVELYGGTNSAINNVPVSATAFGRRSSMFTIQFYTSARGGLPPFPQEGFTLLDGMVNSIVDNSPPNWDYGAYTNYIDDRLQNWQHLYYGPNYLRLRALKDQYDPKDTFKFPLAVEE